MSQRQNKFSLGGNGDNSRYCAAIVSAGTWRGFCGDAIVPLRTLIIRAIAILQSCNIRFSRDVECFPEQINQRSPGPDIKKVDG